MSEERLPSKFAFILHADIAGSTALVQQDEQLTHKRIQDTFRRFSDITTKYHGHVRELRGDALLTDFERASDAVMAALAFQEDQSKYIAQLTDSILPMVRVGIAMGEIIVADDTVTGEGVVLAQRVEQLADPGGVCVTGAIHEALPRRLPFHQDDLGEQEVKGFDEPVRVYKVRLKEHAVPPDPIIAPETKNTSVVQWIVAAAVMVLISGGGLFAWLQISKPDFEPASIENMALPLPNKPSIVVLPFDNYSDDEKLDYIASGLTEDLTTSLSKVPALFVIARNSAATYKDKPVSVRQVAEDLGVQYILEGSIQKAGDELRVNTQLVDALTGHHIWANRFDRPARDIFAVQDEIAKQVVVELQVELTEGVQAQIAARGTKNLDAWLLRVQGLGEMWKWSREGHVRARELYKAAHKADPQWARPVAGLAIISWWEARWGWTDTPEESIRVGKDLAERAISLDPSDIGGYQALANLYFLTNEPDRAIELRRKAIELAPNDAVNLAGTAVRFNEYGMEEEAVELLEQAIRLNPVVPWWFYSGYGLALHLAGRKDEAVEWLEKSAAERQRADTYARLAAVYVDLNRMEDAKAAAAEAQRLNPKLTVSKYQKANTLSDPKRFAWYKDLLIRAGLPR